MMHRLWIALRTVLAATGALFVIATFTPVTGWWAAWLAGPWNDPAGEILIVPGSEVQADGTIGLTTYWRTVYAERAWKAGGFRQIVVSGDLSLARAMKGFLVSQGVPETAVLMESASHSTRQNAVNTAALLARTPGRKVLLTSDYHMTRAFRAFRRAGLEVQPRPVPDGLKICDDPLHRWSLFVTLSFETVKLAVYWVRGWL